MSDQFSVELRESERPLRCAYCHGPRGEAYAACDGCGTVLHVDCLATLDRCPTLGCRVRPTVPSRLRESLSLIDRVPGSVAGGLALSGLLLLGYGVGVGGLPGLLAAWMGAAILFSLVLLWMFLPETFDTVAARVRNERPGDSARTFVAELREQGRAEDVAENAWRILSEAASFPVRPDDDLVRDYRLDEEDFEDCIFELARACGLETLRRSDGQRFRAIHTVRDVIDFIEHVRVLRVRA
ncbi:MAG: hypothetical protein ACAI25_06145 [Planctomycetota bacterium]